MGDQGRLYVAEDIVPVYKSLVREADLVLPNQFEMGLLCGLEEQGGIKSLKDVEKGLQILHGGMGIRHVVVTSVRVNGEARKAESNTRERAEPNPGEEDKDKDKDVDEAEILYVVGSTSTSEGKPRPFVLRIPKLPVFFSGTGDMFAALMVARLRAECDTAGLLDRRGWTPDDEVDAAETPLAKATTKVLSSMQMVLEETKKAHDREMGAWQRSAAGPESSTPASADKDTPAAKTANDDDDAQADATSSSTTIRNADSHQPSASQPAHASANEHRGSVALEIDPSDTQNDPNRKVSADPQSSDEAREKRRYLAETKSAEVRVVRNAWMLIEPEERYEVARLEDLW